MSWRYSLLLLALGPVAQAQAQTQIPGPARMEAPARAAEPLLERRLHLLTRELSLDAAQQASVRHILEQQQARVRAVLASPQLAPAERGPAIGAIQEHTADQIRAVLNEQQQQKYHKARPSSPGSEHPDLQTWLDVANGKRPPPGRFEGVTAHE